MTEQILLDPVEMTDEIMQDLEDKKALDHRVADHQLGADDFVCLRVKYNDPEVSFFSMLAEVPHGEAVRDVDGRPASFYVTESRDLPIDLTDFGDYEICLPENRTT